MTHLEVALEYIRPRVERGDSLDSLIRSCGGSYSGERDVQIGGYMMPTGPRDITKPLEKLKPGEIGIRINDVLQVFKIRDLYVYLLIEGQTQ